MGSDGFESKKLGGSPPGGTAPNRLGSGEFAGSAGRDPTIDAFSGLGDAAAKDPCQRHPDQWPGTGAGQMVQPVARIRLPDLRGGYPGHLRAHGNLAPLRDDRAAPRPVRAGAVRARLQGNDGRRDSAGERLAGIVLALICATPHATVTRAPKAALSSPANRLVLATITGVGSDPANPFGCDERCLMNFDRGVDPRRVRAGYWMVVVAAVAL